MKPAGPWSHRTAGMLVAAVMAATPAIATDYEVGEGAGWLPAIGDVPWESARAG